jgi:anti-sigma factor RsiW
MSSQHEHDFDEALLSGYLDGMLTQQDTQNVRLHLESCASCNQTVSEMNALREVTMTSRFSTPPDDQWDERPRGIVSRLSFGLGWAIIVAWIVGLLGFTLGQIWSGPESLTEKLLVFGAISGFALLLLSVLIDRLKSYESDRYRGVEK